MKKIELTRGLFAIVDDDDYVHLSKWKWHAIPQGKSGKFKAARRGSKKDGKKTVLMSRQLMDPRDSEDVDHRDGDTLNNRRKNLRICSHADNCINHPGWSKETSSKFKGVSFNKKRGKWIAYFRRKHIGVFATEIEAAVAYDAKAFSYSPSFSNLNFGDGGGVSLVS